VVQSPSLYYKCVIAIARQPRGKSVVYLDITFHQQKTQHQKIGTASKNKSQLSFTSVGRADEAAAVAGVYVKCYDGVCGNDALHYGDENEETVALAAVAATEKLQ
jgi:hypothetical protein